MRCLGVVAVLLCVSSMSLAAVTYDGGTTTLTYGSPADLDSVIDPTGVGADVQQEFGMTKAAFEALAPQVVGFNTSTGIAQGTPNKLVVQYSATDTVRFTFAANYNWGGYNTAGRSAFSGPYTFSDISTVETQPDNCWFDVPAITVSPAGQGVKAIAFCAHGRNDGTTPPPEPPFGPNDKQSGPGDAVFTLSDGSTQSVHYDMFGGNGIALQRIFIGYQAPEGKTITAFRCTRPGSGNSYIAVDDLAFVMVPEPATMCLLGLGALALVRRRR